MSEYYRKGIECWDYIIAKDLNYLEGNIIKYITRYREKGGLVDLNKAKEYLNKLIEIEQGKTTSDTTHEKIKNIKHKAGEDLETMISNAREYLNELIEINEI